MAVAVFEKPNYYNKIYKSVGLLDAATAGALGSDSNGVAIHTFTNDGFVASLKIFTNDAANNGAWIYILDGSTVIPEASVSVPLNSGNTAAVAGVDALANAGVSSRGDWIEQNGKRVIPCEAGQVLKFSAITTLGAGEKMWATAVIYEKVTS
jgi:hypothetical protein